jgi:hypothetical protein
MNGEANFPEIIRSLERMAKALEALVVIQRTQLEMEWGTTFTAKMTRYLVDLANQNWE